jgi:steroid 5-alpha reductase family enzyme
MEEWKELIVGHLMQAWKIQQCIHTSENTFSGCMLLSDPLDISIWFLILVIMYSFVWSIIGNNCSKVDQIWSIVPWLYMWIFFLHYYYTHKIIHQKLFLVTILSTLWGIRLTFNFWRRGGYGNFITHEEDYRWPIVRSKINNSFVFFVFNFVFIASYQNILLWLISLPAYLLLKQDSKNISLIDLLITSLYVFFLCYETIADQQQYNFQQKKYSFSLAERKNHSDHSIRNGFLTSGLFQFSRHPNYFAEQSLWVCIYFFSISSGEEALINWTIIGCLLLILLFQGSTTFSESITAEKYPAYLTYQQEVSQTIPWFSLKKKKN